MPSLDKRLVAALVTGSVLVGATVWSWRAEQRASATRVLATPDACLVEMTRAAQQGDVGAYLNCFAGPLRDELLAQSRSAAGLADSLRQSVAQLKGTASYEERPATTDAADMVLERIYAGHNESWRVALERTADAWRIITMTRIGSTNPPIEYGTPVFEGLEQRGQGAGGREQGAGSSEQRAGSSKVLASLLPLPCSLFPQNAHVHLLAAED
ncbi:MAG TPA: hypothetical protein VHZ24_04920 [Pirellulales bacterium]|jgi:hypothetical protein|nr:hypothetical protein [Pirellulales bacterium]